MFEQSGATVPPPVTKGAAPAKRWAKPAAAQPANQTPVPVEAHPTSGGAKAAAAMFQGKIEAATPAEPATTGHRQSASKQTPAAAPAPVQAPPPVPQDPVWHVRALYPYTANSETELSFQAGAEITIHHKDPGGWWEGEVNGARGWLPMNYVQEI